MTKYKTLMSTDDSKNLPALLIIFICHLARVTGDIEPLLLLGLSKFLDGWTASLVGAGGTGDMSAATRDISSSRRIFSFFGSASLVSAAWRNIIYQQTKWIRIQ